MTRLGTRLALLALVLPLVVPLAAKAQPPEFSARITWTAHGIPHVTADDYAGLGYGYGYAFAKDNLCALAEEIVTVNAQRSRWFGPDGEYRSWGNGLRTTNLKSDFFFQHLNDRDATAGYDQPPPLGMSADVKRVVAGYAAGYNRWLADHGTAGTPCDGAPWVRPITELDLKRRFYQLTLLASSFFFAGAIVDAKPPAAGASGLPAAAPPVPAAHEFDPAALPSSESLGIGSNAYGIGKAATANGKGMVLGNPHFPWQGPERFHQMHLTIPGELDVSGAALFGAPGVLIGHNEHVGWSHTVSTAYRFTPYELTLVPGEPTKYVHDGQVRELQPQTVTVQSRRPDGTLEQRSTTIWHSHYGPVVEYPAAFLQWSPAKAYAIRDANAMNYRVLDQFLAMNKAGSVRELKAAQETWQAIPWVNTMAADSSGEAYYADQSVVPNVPDELVAQCMTPVGAVTFAAARLPVLNGSTSACDWKTDPDAVQPGIFGPANLPDLLRDDYVHNSNDSYWLANPHEPLEGYDRIIGDERSARSLRTRMGLHIMEDRLAGRDGLPGDRWQLPQLGERLFSNRNMSGELAKDAAVTMCSTTPTMISSGGAQVDVAAACQALAGWDTTANLDATGAAVWREFWRRAAAVNGGPWVVPFNPQDPLNTPNTLNVAHPQVRTAFADAVLSLRQFGIDPAAKLGDIQGEYRGAERIPVHGGPHVEGVFNYIAASLGQGGWNDVYHGSSFIMTVSFTDAGPSARTLVTYSQSTDPASPFWADQLRMFSAKQWNEVPFRHSDVQAQAIRRDTVRE
ncbi:MAG TPA: penicillin acylase family protein [Egibacteraceae bacterium]|nr:penicillin acylase family protein [Egibacteraceae bacterium]